MHPHESSKQQLAITDEARRPGFGLRGRLGAWTRHRDACGCCDSALHVRSTQYKACQNNNAAGDQQCLEANSGKRARKTITLVRRRTRVAYVLGFADASTPGRDTGTLVGAAIPLYMYAAPNKKLVKNSKVNGNLQSAAHGGLLLPLSCSLPTQQSVHHHDFEVGASSPNEQDGLRFGAYGPDLQRLPNTGRTDSFTIV